MGGIGGLLSVIGVGGTGAGIKDGADSGAKGKAQIDEANRLEGEMINCIINVKCNLSSDELKIIERRSRELKRNGIKNIGDAAFKLGTAVPGTSVTGGIPTSKSDLSNMGVGVIIDAIQ